MRLRTVTAAAAMTVSLAGCTSPSTPRGEAPLAKLTARQLCALMVETGGHLVSWRSSTSAAAKNYLGVTLQGPWDDSPAATRAAVCTVRDHVGTVLYAINVNGVSLKSQQGIVLVAH